MYRSKKDKEFEAITQSIYESSSKMAHIALGDFNEVSWGKTFKRFWKKSKLLDPRRGRFFKSTFPTYLPFRVPLDHVLCSSEFELVRFDRLEHIGSDHFPLYCILQLKQ